MITLEVFKDTEYVTEIVADLRHIANLIEEGYTSGYDPEWTLTENNDIRDESDIQAEYESGILLELADKIYSNVYSEVDDKKFYNKKLSEIFDWLCNGDWSGTIEELTDEWKEYDQEEEVE